MKALATIRALGCCEFREHYRCVETAVIKEKYHKALYEFMGFRRQRARAGAFGDSRGSGLLEVCGLGFG